MQREGKERRCHHRKIYIDSSQELTDNFQLRDLSSRGIRKQSRENRHSGGSTKRHTQINRNRMEAPAATTGAGGGTAVWVRRSLLLSALSQSSAGTNSNNKLSKTGSSNKLSRVGSEEDRASDFTALTANSSTASPACSAPAPSTSTADSWGWVRARLSTADDKSAARDNNDNGGADGGGVVVKVADGDHPDLDGRSVSIPSGLLNTIPSATASTSSTSSNKSKSAGSNNGGEEGTVYGPDLVMANAAGEESPADLIQVSFY